MTKKMPEKLIPSRAVLGIDAAWTARNPSGVALAVEIENEWRLAAVDGSYSDFIQRASASRLDPREMSFKLNTKALLKAAEQLEDRSIDLVTIDLPLSRDPITSRRVSDNLISSKFGPYGCSTHTPSQYRPGHLSEVIRDDFAAVGYHLLTGENFEAPIRGVAEVYPHPAILALTKSAYRVPYKSSKTRSYWPDDDVSTRRQNLKGIWQGVIDAFESGREPRIKGVRQKMPLPDLDSFGTIAKGFEDKLDAIVCAWVGVCLLHKQAEPFGDDKSAIWVPKDGYIAPHRPARQRVS